MSELFTTAIVEKRNVLNELRCNNMTLQELRFFSIYLSKINPYDISTRSVRFSIEDFKRIMNLNQLNIFQLRASTDSLLCKIVHIPTEKGGYESFQLFKKCKVDKDDAGEWFFEIDAHDNALPLMFDFKNRYFKYELWNALRLKSANQVRMYEILKQYESIGKRELSIKNLRELLGIEKKEYSGRTGWSDFKKYVLDSCQEALKENTDICYTYERGKTGQGGKWLSIIFYIFKNTEYKDKLSLEEFIESQSIIETNCNSDDSDGGYYFSELDNSDEDNYSIEVNYGSDLDNLLGDTALNNEFTVEQVKVIKDLVMKIIKSGDNIEMCDYLIGKVHKMDLMNVKNRFGYLSAMLENEINKDKE